MKMRAKDMRQLLSKFDAGKYMGSDEIHPKILKYLSSNGSFINSISKLFKKFIEYENILYIWKTAIVIPLHKKSSIHLKSDYRRVYQTWILRKAFENTLNFKMGDMNCNLRVFVIVKLTLANILENIDNR